MTSGSHRTTIDIGGLLSIDVASELRKLSQAQLQGPWQIPAELVRRALRSRAGEVRVTFERHQAHIVDDGEGIAGECLQWTAIVLDPRRPNEERHAALTALERSGQLALLAVAGLPPKVLRIESIAHGSRWVLEYHHGRAPWLEVREGIAGQSTEVLLKSSTLDRRQMSVWLENVARFAPGDVRLESRRLSTGFEHALVQAPLDAPLVGRIAIPMEGETAHAWLLEHGLVTGHVAIPDAPSLEAAIELGTDAGDISAARLRDAVQPLVPGLVEQAVGLLSQLGQRPGPHPEALRARLARLVLHAAHKRLRFEDMIRVPVFQIVDGQGARLVDLLTLRHSAQRDPSRTRVLPALYPTQKPERFALGNAPVLIADAVERSRLAELMHVRFRPPDPRDASSSWVAIVRRGKDRFWRELGRTREWLRHPLRPATLEDATLHPPERSLLEALREHLELPCAVGGVRMCAGSGPIRRSRGKTPDLLLPRGNSSVRAAVTAVARDPAWIYPVSLALLEGRGLPPAPARKQWLGRDGEPRGD
jgi:hypothetical protein